MCSFVRSYYWSLFSELQLCHAEYSIRPYQHTVCITFFISQPSIQSNWQFFGVCHDSLNYCQAIVLDIDRHYTMAWFPASLLKTPRRFSACATTMCVRFVCARRCYATMVKMRHSLASSNSKNFDVYGQKHKGWVLVFLVRTSRTI